MGRVQKDMILANLDVTMSGIKITYEKEDVIIVVKDD
jgi:hypothetical protein